MALYYFARGGGRCAISDPKISVYTSDACCQRFSLGAVERAPTTFGCGCGTACRSEEHTSELQSLMRISYAVFCLKKKNHQDTNTRRYRTTGTIDALRCHIATVVSTDTKSNVC